jgi:hypothetical protein
MTGQHEPEGTNRFETWADGQTPAGDQLPSSGRTSEARSAGSPIDHGHASAASASEPPTWTPPRDTVNQSFPPYPYAAPSGEQRDEAFEAFQGYQASTNSQQGYSPQQGYSQPLPYQDPGLAALGRLARPGPNASFATPSLVLGILSLLCGGVTGPIGLGLGVAALKQIEAAAGRLGGRGIAITGIVLSGLGTLYLLLLLLGALVG